MSAFASIEDYRARAQRTIPRFAFDFIEGGAGTEAGLARNRAAFESILLKPRVLAGFQSREQRTTLLGQAFSAPFGIAPIGLANVAWPGTDLKAARAAAAGNIPYVLSNAASTSIERIWDAAPEHAWFQLYVGRDEEVVSDLIRRASSAGCTTLVVTVDVPLPGRRHRDIRNRLALPLRPTPSLLAQLLLRPRWLISTLMSELPRTRNYDPYLGSGSSKRSMASFMADQVSTSFCWDDLRHIRDKWKGKLVVKGILDRRDAVLARDLGADAIVVSNHGGRQLDSAPAPLEALAEIRDSVGPDYPIIADSGFRSGEDVVKGLVCGADFVLLGRAFIYAAAAGDSGIFEAISMIKTEIDITLAQIGCESVDALRSGRGAASDFVVEKRRRKT